MLVAEWNVTNEHFESKTSPETRATLIRQALHLEYLTVVWMTIEAVVAISSGIAAGSLTLVAFGIDSVIELASAGVLFWRLTVEHRHGRPFAERTERTASRVGGALLFMLAVYILASAGWKLWTRTGAEFSLLGLVVSALAVPIMYILSRRKLVLAQKLQSRALRTDAIESITCGWLAFVVIAALVAQWTIGAWWIDPLASLVVVGFLVREGREAWTGIECCGHT
jgi:divalent metal cation (Fe/Co/Zn/Cd) transporter